MTEQILLNGKAIDDPRNFNFCIWQDHNSRNFYFTSLGSKEGRKESKIRNSLSRKGRWQQSQHSDKGVYTTT